MNRMIKCGWALMCAVGLFIALPARADIPPPDVCQTDHSVCYNAGEEYDQDGVCAQATCSKGSESGAVTMYECLRCVPASPLGAAGALDATDAGNTPAGGCSVRALGTERGVAALMLGLGLCALGVSRRRR